MTKNTDHTHAKKHTSARTTLIGFIFVVVSLVVMAFAIRLAYGGEQQIFAVVREQFEVSQQQHALQLAAHAQAELDAVIKTLETLTVTTEVQDGDTEQCSEFLRAFISRTTLAMGTVSRTNEDQFFDCGNVSTTPGIDGRNFPYLNTIFADPTHKPVIGRGFTSQLANDTRYLTAVHVPIVDGEGAFQGTLGSAIFFDEFMAAVLEDEVFPQETIVVLSDDNGDVLYHTDPTFVSINLHDPSIGSALLENAELQALFERRERGEVGVQNYVFDGEEDIAAFAPIDIPGERTWSVTISTPADEIDPVVLPIVRRIQREIVIVAGISFSLLLLLLFSLVRWNHVLQRTVRKQTAKLSDQNAQLASQLTDLEKQETVLSDSLEQSKTSEKEATQAVENLERTKRAMMNVLEDVREEQEKSLSLLGEMRKFQLAVENTSDMVIISDAEGTILYANPATFAMTGYPPEETLGTRCGALWGGHMEKEFYEKMWATLMKKKVWSGDIRNKRKNGEWYDAAVTISPILNEKNEIMFFVDISRDITREKEIDRAKTEFVSLASHQLRTPLSSINWYAEMLMDGDAGPLNDDQRSYLDQIYKGNQRMVELVNALLNVSRIDMGTFAVNPSAVNIRTIAKDALAEVRILAKKASVSLRSTIATTLPVIQADPKLIRIIFDNLLSNAIKYTPEGGEVMLSVQHKAGKTKKGSRVRIQVRDTGYDIPEEQQAKIFTKLFRADNVVERDTEGTGLGLYIVKSIVEETGGTISFTSKKDKGTTFTVELPVVGMKKREGTKELS